jgi:hypothetical protein
MKKVYIFTICFALLSFNTLAQKYVKPSSSGTGDGSSWVNASSDLQGMINASAAGEEVWVASGTYKPTEKLDLASTNDRDKTFKLKAGVKIYGGFSGNEALLSERNPSSNVTILSGDLNNDNLPNIGDNYHVVASAGSSTGAVLDGFTIQHGFADGTVTVLQAKQNQGAGINITNEEASITFKNLIIRDNSSSGTGNGGAGVYLNLLNNSDCIFDNIVFDNNRAITASGGAMFFTSGVGSPKVTVTNSKVFRSAGTSGAGLYVIGTLGNVSNFKLFNTIFSENRASSTPGGGAVYVAGYTNTDVINCTFYNNSNANGAFSYNNALHTVLNLYNCIFNKNSTNSAGTTPADIRKITGATLDFRSNLFQLSPIEDTDPEYNNTINNTPTLLFLSTTSSDANFLKLIEGAATEKGDNSFVTNNNITLDLAGETRIKHTNVDLGAYEFQGTLPVQLTNFTIKKTNNEIFLDWIVASESDNEKFIVERSNDGVLFERLGEVYSKGDTDVKTKYNFKDSYPLKGYNYYKLLQRDNNGTIKSLGIKVINFDFLPFDIVLYPNPTNDIINVKLGDLDFANLNVELVSSAGNKVLAKRLNSINKGDLISLDVSKFPPGIYILLIDDGQRILKERVILR